jgi:hypothetical protein
LIQWHWKLAGLELPSAIKIALAKKLATILKPAKPGQEQGHSQDHGRDYGRSPRGTTEGSMPR